MVDRRTARAHPKVDESTLGLPARDHHDEPPDSHARRLRWLIWAALTAVLALTVAVRVPGLTSLGLWRDDAWVALSSRVDLSTAWHMWFTTPGFHLLERATTSVGSSATWVSQLPPLVFGIAGVPAIYALARFFKLSQRAALAMAVLICVSPPCIIYSTRVKEYTADFLLTCLLLALTEAARRQTRRRQLNALALASVFAFFVSATVAPVIIGLWLVLGFFALRDGQVLRRVAVAGAVAAVGCGAVAAVFYHHISPVLANSFNGYYIVHTSPREFVLSLYHTLWNVFSQFFGISVFTPGEHVAITVALLALAALGTYRKASMFGPALVVAVAFGLCAAHVAPLGLGRTEIYLYPALLLLWAAGANQVVVFVGGLVSKEVRPMVWPYALAAALVAGLLVYHGAQSAPLYPSTDVKGLVAKMEKVEVQGDRIVVGELMRYPWALYEDNPPHIEFGSDWSAGFTVLSTNPHVYIVPSEVYERGFDPSRWASGMSRYHVLWFVWAPPLSLNPAYAALIHDGWHQFTTVSAAGSDATLLVRTG
jgi:hypothetical protein